MTALLLLAVSFSLFFICVFYIVLGTGKAMRDTLSKSIAMMQTYRQNSHTLPLMNFAI